MCEGIANVDVSEIEITPEMIAAGVPELLNYDPRYEPPEAAVERLFAVMVEAYKRG